MILSWNMQSQQRHLFVGCPHPLPSLSLSLSLSLSFPLSLSLPFSIFFPSLHVVALQSMHKGTKKGPNFWEVVVVQKRRERRKRGEREGGRDREGDKAGRFVIRFSADCKNILVHSRRPNKNGRGIFSSYTKRKLFLIFFHWAYLASIKTLLQWFM